KSTKGNVNPNVSLPLEIVLFIVDSGCSKHMTGNLKLLINFVETFMGTVKFGNDQIEPILGYGDLGNDLLIGSRGTDLYSITLQESNYPNPICLMAKATSSQAWLWHRRLSHLNFDTINLLSKNDIVVGLPKLKFVKDHLCSSCELGKAKRKSFQTKLTPSSKRRLQLLHMGLCGPMRVASINGKRYVLVIIDDYSRYTWTHFLRSKDETPEVLIDFLRLVQRGLQAQVRVVRTDKGTEFLNQTLHAYFAAEGIQHQTSVARTLEQNGVVKRQNHTLVEATRTMLSVAKVPIFFWAKVTQNRSLVIPRHEKTPYHIINDLKPSVKFFHIFGSVCYIVRDGENLDKMKEKGDECISVGYSTQSRAYRVINKRIRVIMESIHVNFNELPQMASTMALEHGSLSPGRKCHENVSHGDKTDTTSNELDLLFSLMFDELLNGSSKVVSKSSAVSAVDESIQRQQQPKTPLNNHTTPAPTCQTLPIASSVTSNKNINQAEPHTENDEVADDEFINIFSTPVQDQGETSSCHVDSSNMHTFYQHFVVLDFVADPRIPWILGRPFLRGIDFDSEEIKNFLNDDSIPFGVEDSPFNMEEEILFLESLLIEYPFPPHPIIPNKTKSPIEEPKHSFNMGYEHFNTNLVTKDDSDPHQEEIDVVAVTDDVLPPSVENEDSDGEADAVDVLQVDNFIQNSEHEYSESEDSDFVNRSLPLPPPEPPDEEFDFENDFENELSVVRNTIVKFECIDARIVFNEENDDLSYFMFAMFDKVFSFLSAESEDTIFHTGISD
nr:hypothetical protein [Tanacetum cinerariifolium]